MISLFLGRMYSPRIMDPDAPAIAIPGAPAKATINEIKVNCD